MHRCTFVTLCLLSLAVSTGCVFSKKDAKKKESSSMAAEMEADFKNRWVEKRVAELTSKGSTVDAARAQAIEEFRVKYEFTSAAHK